MRICSPCGIYLNQLELRRLIKGKKSIRGISGTPLATLLPYPAVQDLGQWLSQPFGGFALFKHSYCRQTLEKCKNVGRVRSREVHFVRMSVPLGRPLTLGRMRNDAKCTRDP
jgi:hypothetical protein